MKLSKDALFEYLGYAPHAAQAEVHRSTASRRVVASGVRVGKSTLAAYETIAYLMEPREKTLVWLAAPTHDLAGRIFGRVNQLLHEKLAHRIVRFDPRAHSVVIVNLSGGRSELKTKSADRPVTLLGESVNALIVDEAAKLNESVWSQHLAPRVLDQRGDVLLLSTPSGVGWFRNEFKRGIEPDRDPAYESFTFPTSSNPLIAPELIEAERKRLDPDVFREQYLAEFLGAENEPCTVCGGPDPFASAVIIVESDDEPKSCPQCKGHVHDNGRTAVAIYDGRRSTTMIRLEAAPDAEIPLPI